MSKRHHPRTRQPHESRKRPAIRWPQWALVSGVVLLVAVVLILKDRTAGPPSAAGSNAEATVVLPQATVEFARTEGQIGATAQPNELPEAQLERLLAAGQPVLAFYHSTNCAKCIQMMEVVAQVHPEFDGSVGLVDVNVYDKRNTNLLQRARIRAIPTQVFFDETGQEKVVMGVMTPEELREQLQALAGACSDESGSDACKKP